MTAFVVAIPARYAASRLPGKPLRLLDGEPLVLHVARRALAAGAREVWVAADDQRIADALDGSGVRIAMTSPEHASGTDRLAECARIAGWSDDTIVVNLQGDEPFAPASGIQAAAKALADSGAEMATLSAANTMTSGSGRCGCATARAAAERSCGSMVGACARTSSRPRWAESEERSVERASNSTSWRQRTARSCGVDAG